MKLGGGGGMGDGRCLCSWVVSEQGTHFTQSMTCKNGARIVEKKIDWRGCHFYAESEKKKFVEMILLRKKKETQM